MTFYDSIHETCITVPCKDDVVEGQFCAFDAIYGVRHADYGECPQGLVKYVRNGMATVQIHGLVTVPVVGGSCPVGKVALVTGGTYCNVQKDENAAESYLVVANDKTAGTVTLMLG